MSKTSALGRALRSGDRQVIKEVAAQDARYARQMAENKILAMPENIRDALPGVDGGGFDLANGRGWMSIDPASFGGKKHVSFFTNADPTNRQHATDIFASARENLRKDMDSRPWWEPSSGYRFYPLTPKHERIYDRFVRSFDHPDYKAVKVEDAYELRRKFPLRHEVAAAATIGAPAAVLWPQDAEGGVSSPALGVPAVPGVPDSVGAPPASALARALARQAPEFNRALDTSLDVASFFDPSMGYATETARALKDLPAKVGPAGAVALAPLTGATEALGSIGQLPELGVAGGRALARALTRPAQPRGSQTYRKKK